MELEDFDDNEIIAEIKRRKLEDEFESDDVGESECDIEDFDNDELLAECNDRGFKVVYNEDFADLDLTSVFADAIWENMAEIIKKNGEQKLHDILELYLR